MLYFICLFLGFCSGFGLGLYLKDMLHISFDPDGHKTTTNRREINGEVTGND